MNANPADNPMFTKLKGRVPFSRILLVANILLLSACDRHEINNLRSGYVHDKGITYLNTTTDVAYVGSEECQECHSKIYDTYKESQTGRSMGKMDPSNVIEIFPQEKAVYDSASNFYYEMVREEDKFYQREYRLDARGQVMHERRLEAQYVMGSGRNLRMYFYNENGMLYQLPLTWYENEVRWKLSPGYREFGNLRFYRYATAKCLFCHSGYLEESSAATDRYLKPDSFAIGCERCHGPGDLHVQQKRGVKIDLASDNALTIVNPSKLSLQRQIDLCRQCHLQGRSRVLHGENQWFDFRPGMLLEGHHSEYFPDEIHVEAFKVANTAFRLEQSRCFTESHGMASCTICHDAHRSLTSDVNEYQNRNCQKCHPPANLPGEESRFTHTASDNCVPCHMNQTASDNTLHGVINTDHWIRIDANMTKIDWSGYRESPQKKPPVRLVPYVDAQDEKTDTRLGIAYFEYYKESDNRKAYLDLALKYLSRGLSQVEHDPSGEFYRGLVLLELKRYEKSISSFKRVIALEPNAAEAYFKLGEVYKVKRKIETAVEHYRRASSLKPDEPRYLEGLGIALADAGQSEEAVSVLERSLLLDKQSPYPYYSLGNLYALTFKDPARALPYFKQLVVVDPDFNNGYLNLANTYALLGNYDDAVRTYEKEIFTRPNSVNSYINIGRVSMVSGRIAEARRAFEKVMEMDPDNSIARANLSELAASENE